ncbi:MAG TPA: hypothetical protein VMV73_06560, partial [Candidatus Dormibacteraeota bacterium]|nr:hypothetical protein [Candidatus Dormibacteraeota bacterium]
MKSYLAELAAFLIAALVSLAIAPLVIRLATHLEIIDGVEEERRVHESPTPRIGGVAVFVGFATALFAVLGFVVGSPHARGAQLDIAHHLIGLLFGSLLILGVGLWDDVMQMRARSKLIAQVIVAAISMLYGFTITGVNNPFAHAGST